MSIEPLRLSILGTDFAVSSDSPALLAAIAQLWPAFCAVSQAQRPVTLSAHLDGDNDSAAWRRDRVASLNADLNRLALEGYQDFAAHSGVVALGDRLVALPAESGTGKTTMVAACSASGWKYVSDESLCLGYADALVEPYAKPLALSRWSAAAVRLVGGFDAGEEVLATAADLGATTATSRLPLTDLVRLERSPAAAPALTRLHPADGVPLLLGMSFNHYRRRAESFALVTGLAQHWRVWTLTYSDPMAAADLLTARLT